MLTPRQYLSWSAMDLFEKDIEKWKSIYLYDGPKMNINRGMAFGKQMADGLEKNESTGDPVLDLVIDRLPKFEIMDKAFETVLKNGKNPVPILIKPDTMKADMTAFKEYKTGQARWTKKQVDESGQITFYATGIFLITGKIPTDIELVHVLTEKLDETQPYGPIGATGDIIRHPTARRMSDILNMMVRMKRAWISIGQITEKELI